MTKISMFCESCHKTILPHCRTAGYSRQRNLPLHSRTAGGGGQRNRHFTAAWQGRSTLRHALMHNVTCIVVRIVTHLVVHMVIYIPVCTLYAWRLPFCCLSVWRTRQHTAAFFRIVSTSQCTPPPLYKLRQSPKLIRSLRLL